MHLESRKLAERARLVAAALLSLFLIGFAGTARGAEGIVPFDGEKSSWHGFDRYDFLMDETDLTIKPYKVAPDEKNAVKAQVKGQRRCVVVVPKTAAAGNPWSWQGCYWDHEPQAEVELLKRRFHIAFAAPDAGAQGKVWDTWYKFLTEKHGLAKKAAFIGMSKGGVNEFNWGVVNPDKVACIYADNTALYDEDFAKVPELAKHDIPLLHICGSEDFLVQRHTRVVDNTYHQLGGLITVIVKEGHAHHPHSLQNAKPIADWIEQHMTPSTANRPAFVDATFTKGYYYSLEPSYIYLKEEDTYATARGPGFTECYDRYDGPTSGKFKMGGISIIVPKTVAVGKPWVFTGDPIERDATVEQALLAKGYHILIVSPMGSGMTQKQWDDAYKLLVDNGFSKKPVLKGTGAMAGEAYAWAVANPDKVSCIYARNPLMKSLMAGKEQPIDNLAALAKAGVPVLHDCGALDPWLDKQTRVVEKRYKELDGKITVIVREGEGHFPLSPKDPKSVVDFIIKNALAGTTAGAGQYATVEYPPSTAENELQVGVTYTLWIPEGVKTLRGVIVHQHGAGTTASKEGATAAYDLHWQALAKKWDCALLGPSYHVLNEKTDITPGGSELWFDPRRGSEKAFLKALDDLAAESGHPELKTVPWVLWGHSGGGIWSDVMTTLHPDRVVAVWMRSGTALMFLTHAEFTRPKVPDALAAIPMMCNPGVKEKPMGQEKPGAEDNRTVEEKMKGPWLGSLATFKEYRAKGVPIGLAPDPRTGHECGDSRYLAIPFLDACLAMRLPDKGAKDQTLKPIDQSKAWLAPLLGEKAEAAASYQGNPKEAVWLPNEAVAKAWMEYVKTGAVGDTTPPPAPTNVRVSSKGDKGMEITWDAEADFESGIRGFIVLRDGEELAQVPPKPVGKFGRPLFQSMTYHDTPSKPLPEMRYVDASAKPDDKHTYAVITVNSVELKSEPSAKATLQKEPPTQTPSKEETSRPRDYLFDKTVSREVLDIHVAPNGDDANPGTVDKPVRTPLRARDLVRTIKAKSVEPITVHFAPGTYYLAETFVLGPEDSGTEKAPITYVASTDGPVILSGGVKLDLKWKPYKDGIMQTESATARDGKVAIDQLFVNGRAMPMARYPNYKADARPFNGTAADAISPERVKRWANPVGAYVHALHANEWGGFHYRITGVDDKGNAKLEGGWQNNRRTGMHKQHRFVENVFEELDAPGEWFHDAAKKMLYFYPPQDVDLNKATVEAAGLRHLVEFHGARDKPVRFVVLKGFTFTHTARTFMENREPLLRSDWTIYRGGAVMFEGCEDCGLDGCFFDQVGGNAVFVNKYNLRVAITTCKIVDAGASGVCFVGDPKAVRSPLFEYGEKQPLEQIDRTPGPKTDDYPAKCRVHDCLIHGTGRVEKQSAGVEISMSAAITVSHCSIYEVPRAGINIGDGCWGGHVIEHNDVFDTVRETGDHGSFNSWGRDRYWLPDIGAVNRLVAKNADLPLLDCRQPIVLRNNRWRCDHGWDIDLDDGSTNFKIENNLCLHGGLKLRDGYQRTVENNVIVGNSFHPHVWYAESRDVFRHNVVATKYQPIRMPKSWGKEVDANFFADEAALRFAQKLGLDADSAAGDPQFVDAAKGDYRVKDGSAALKVGFKNFPMIEFGVVSPRLRAEARTPTLPTGAAQPPALKPLEGVKRIVFLGDSITYAGGYIDDIEAYLVARYPNQRFEVINLGLPSETVSGLSEPNHAGGKFPRPDLHERLDRVLDRTKADLVVACYGMNDAIYYPFSDERFRKYQDGVETLRAAVAKASATLWLVTPPPFDPVPLAGRTLPEGRDEYGSDRPFEGYDEVLKRYSAWLIGQRKKNWNVIDVHTPLADYMAEQRKHKADFKLAGDGVHLDATGHHLIAREVLRAWGAAADDLDFTKPKGISPELMKQVGKRQQLVRDAYLTDIGHKRPGMAKGFPLDQAIKQAAEMEAKIRELAKPESP